MPFDPLVKAFLDQLSAVPGPKTWQMTPDQARETFAGMMQVAGPRDVPIGKVVNLAAESEDGPIPLRSYTPVAASAEPLPTLIYFHGGGFVFGNLDTHDGLCRLIANESGCRVIAVDYRLAPEHKYPAAVDDAVRATEWIAENASQLGVDANRLAVGGDSAGGALAAIVCQQARKKGGPEIDFQLLMFPVTQIGTETNSLREFAEGYFLETATLNWFYNHYLPSGADDSDPRISPLSAESAKGLPRAYVTVAGFDPLHDEGVAYAEKLLDAGVSVTIVDYTDMVHDFTYMQSVLPQAPEALAAAARALKDALSEG